jgi:tetratricopeptide (TPR) repeat protein
MVRAKSLRHCVPTALAVALAIPALALASADPGVRALSDLTPVPDSAGTSLAPLKPLVCRTAVKGHAPHTGSAAKALKAGEALLARKASRSALRKALRSRSSRSPAGAETLAMAAVGAGKPGAALAALAGALRAHPKDPVLLANASVILTDIGRPLDGLALARAAAGRSHGSGPLGIDRRALALNNEGFALLALRRYSAAVAPLKQAAARAPLLAEARRNLAVAYLCSGQDAQAGPAYAAGLHRQTDLETVAIESPGGPGQGFVAQPGSQQPKAAPILDLTHGEQATIPALKVPPDPKAGVASADMLDSLFHRRNDEANDLIRQSSARSLETGITDPGQLVRMTNIQSVYVNWPGQRPDLRSGFEQIDQLHTQMDAKFDETWLHKVPDVFGSCVDKPTTAQRDQCFATDCRAVIDAAHDQWLPIANQANALAHQWGPDLFNFGTAVAANISNQAGHDAIVLLTRANVWDTYSVYVLQRIAAWASAEKSYSECIEPPPAPEAETGADSEPAGIACPPQLNALDLHMNLGVIKFSVNCESISASTGLPGVVGPFGTVGYAFKSAQTTAFVGLRGGIDQVPGFNVGAKGGVYMTWDSHGNPTDCGLRATASAGTVIPYDLGPSASGKVQVSLAGVFL